MKTTRDFLKTASEIRNMPVNERPKAALEAAKLFNDSNPLFNTVTFMHACMVRRATKEEAQTHQTNLNMHAWCVNNTNLTIVSLENRTMKFINSLETFKFRKASVSKEFWTSAFLSGVFSSDVLGGA